MATTMYFEETLTDKGGAGQPIELEFGCSTYYGESLVYLIVNGETVILDSKKGKELTRAMTDLGRYLGHERDG